MLVENGASLKPLANMLSCNCAYIGVVSWAFLSTVMAPSQACHTSVTERWSLGSTQQPTCRLQFRTMSRDDANGMPDAQELAAAATAEGLNPQSLGGAAAGTPANLLTEAQKRQNVRAVVLARNKTEH